MPLDHARFDQKLEVSGDAGLRLTENGGQVRNGQVLFRNEEDEAEARRLGQGLQHLNGIVEGGRHAVSFRDAQTI
jgi:hypothetical protein